MAETERSNMIKTNFFYAFIYAALAIILPLYLVEKGMNIAEVGLIMAILPLVMFFARTVFGILGDIIGVRAIFFVSGVTTLGSLFIYALANSAAMFSLGKVFEGFRTSAFWAVNRTEIYRIAKKDEGDEAAHMLGIRMTGDFVAKIAAGFAITLLGFFNALAALFIAGFAYMYYTNKIENGKREHKENITIRTLKKRIFAPRTKNFWYSLVIVPLSAPLEILIPFLFPLYLASAFIMSAAEIGVLLAILSLSYAVTALASAKYDLSARKSAILGIIFIAIPLLFMQHVDRTTIYAMTILIGIGFGFEGFVFEHIIARGTETSSAVSTDISIFIAPFKLIEMISYAGIGAIVATYGFYAGFSVLAITTAIFCISGGIFMKE